MPNFFEVTTPLSVKVTCSSEYWEYVVSVKHPVMRGKKDVVVGTLEDPDEIRRSKIDPDFFLYYKNFERLFCSVAKHEDPHGFLITTYPADKVKEGEVIWTK